MKDYKLEIKVKNGLLWAAMKEAGHDTVASLSRACDVSQQELGLFMNLRKPPVGKSGSLCLSAQRLCEYFGVGIEYLFPEDVIWSGVENNRVDRWISARELMGIGQSESLQIEHQLDNDKVIREILSALRPREKQVVSMRFGLGSNKGDDKCLHEIGDQFGVSGERIKQIEEKAFMKMRSPDLMEKISG